MNKHKIYNKNFVKVEKLEKSVTTRNKLHCIKCSKMDNFNDMFCLECPFIKERKGKK